MTKVKAVPNIVCKTFRSLGISQEVTLNLVNCIDKWVRTQGPEMTVHRLKALKERYIHCNINGEAPPLQQTGQWIACDSNGFPKGPFGILFKLPPSERSHRKVITVLNAYHGFVSEQVTVKQWEKFHTSVTGSPSIDRLTVDVTYGLDRFVPRIRRWSLATTTPQFSEEFVRQVFSRTKGFERSPISACRRLTADAMNYSAFRSFLEERGVDVRGIPSMSKNYADLERSSEAVGFLGITQETGYKMRCFASPYPHWQALLEPMKETLMSTLRAIPEDCTYNQNIGVSIVQGWLREHRRVHSVDLSDATNNFPLSIQEKVLDSLNCPDFYKRVLRHVARSPYQFRHNLGEGEVCWNVGQPLGAGPSFPTFALTHHALVRACCEKVGAPVSSYVILGDDIVIADDGVHQEYMNQLALCQIPISHSKCISGGVAEFAGQLITPDFTIQSYKYRTPSDLSFVEVARNFPSISKASGMFSKEQLAYLSVIEPLPQPHGLGRNAHGLSLEDRTILELTLKDVLELPPREILKRKGVDLVNKLNYALDPSMQEESRVPDVVSWDALRRLQGDFENHTRSGYGYSKTFLEEEVILPQGGDPRQYTKYHRVGNPNVIDAALLGAFTINAPCCLVASELIKHPSLLSRLPKWLASNVPDNPRSSELLVHVLAMNMLVAEKRGLIEPRSILSKLHEVSSPHKTQVLWDALLVPPVNRVVKRETGLSRT